MASRMSNGGYSPRLASHWDRLQGDTHYGPTADFLVTELKSRNLPIRIFEIGCGTGMLAECLISRGAELVGLWDRSVEMRKVADERLGKHMGDTIKWLSPELQCEDQSCFGAYIGQRMSPTLNELRSIIQHSNKILIQGGILLLSYWTGRAADSFNVNDWPPVDISIGPESSCVRLNGWDFVGTNEIDRWRFACLYVESSGMEVEFGEFELPRLKDADVELELVAAGFRPCEISREVMNSVGITIAGVKC